MTKTVYSDSSSSLLRESCRWDGEGGVHTCVAMYSDSSAILSREPPTGWVVKQQWVWSGDKKVCRYYQAGISSPAAAPNPIKTTATLQPPYLGEGVLNIRWTPPPNTPIPHGSIPQRRGSASGGSRRKRQSQPGPQEPAWGGGRTVSLTVTFVTIITDSQAHKNLRQGAGARVTKSHCCCNAHRIHANRNQRGEGEWG